MKKSYLVLAATFFFGVSCFASSISSGPGCPGPTCALPPVQITSASTLLNSTSITSFSLRSSPSTTNLTSSFSTAENLLSQHSASLPLVSPAIPADSSLAINPLVPEFTSKSKNASPAAEPSSLLFLSVGLLFLPFLRKNRAAKKSLRLRPA